MKSTKGRKWRQLAQPQPREQSKEASPGSLPEFPSGRCCYRSRSNFQRGRVGPGEECLFAMHMNNLWRSRGQKSSETGSIFCKPLWLRHTVPLTSIREPNCCHWLGMFGPAPRGSPKPHCQEQEGCETHHRLEAKEHLRQWRGARKLEVGKVYKIIEWPPQPTITPLLHCWAICREKSGSDSSLVGFSLEATTHGCSALSPNHWSHCSGRSLSLFLDRLSPGLALTWNL